jgi:hypothetical protein
MFGICWKPSFHSVRAAQKSIVDSARLVLSTGLTDSARLSSCKAKGVVSARLVLSVRLVDSARLPGFTGLFSFSPLKIASIG